MIEEKDDTYLFKKILGRWYDKQSRDFKYSESRSGFINYGVIKINEHYDHGLKMIVQDMEELGLYKLKANSWEKGETYNGNFAYKWTASKAEKKRFETFLRIIIPDYNIKKTRTLLKYLDQYVGGHEAVQKFTNYMEGKQ